MLASFRPGPAVGRSFRPGMEQEVKLQVLSKCSRNRLPRNLEDQKLSTQNGIKAYRQGLKRLLEADPDLSPVKAKLVQRELAAGE
jgi:hypothetical protein